MSSPSKSPTPASPQTATTTATAPTKIEKGKEKVEKKKLPTKAQAERWTSSISHVLQDPDGVKAFRTFLEEQENESGEPGEYTKYLDFYLECEEYKAEFKKLEDKAKDIFDEYLAIGADKEVATGGKSVEIGDKLEDEGLEGVTIFDEPQKKVKQKLDDLQYKKFCTDIMNKLKLKP